MAVAFRAFSSLVLPSSRCPVLRHALSHPTVRGGGGLVRAPLIRRSLGVIPNEPWSLTGRDWGGKGQRWEAHRDHDPKRPSKLDLPVVEHATMKGKAADTAVSMEEVMERLVRYWSAECDDGRGAPEPLGPRTASVLVPLVSRESAAASGAGEMVGGGEGVQVLLCTRSAHLSSHAGEVCLPGGKNDPGETDRVAALREANEEVGLPSSDAKVIAELPPFLSKGLVSVRPVVARIRDGFSPVLNASEVDECFYCPLESFLSGGEGYSYRDWEFVEGRHIRVHFFQRGKYQVWGLTAMVLIKVAEIAYGRPAEFALQPPMPRGTDIQHIRYDSSMKEQNLSTVRQPNRIKGDGSPMSRM